MKMAKASEKDIGAAGDLLSLLLAIDRGDYPAKDDADDAPQWFDEDDPEHLRAFYDRVMATMHKAPGFPGRVIGGMCYVILYGENEIVDPASDTLDLHPKFQAAMDDAARWRFLMDWQERGEQPEAMLTMWRKVYAENRLKPTSKEFVEAIDASRTAAIESERASMATKEAK